MDMITQEVLLGLLGAGGAASITPAYVDSVNTQGSSSGTSTVVTIPDTTDGRSQLLIMIATIGTGSPTITTPSGWTLYGTQAGSFSNMKIYTKAVTATASGQTVTVSHNSLVNRNFVVLLYEGVTGLQAGVTASYTASSISSGGASVTPSSAPGIFLGVYMSSSGSVTISTPPSGMTQRLFTASSGGPPRTAIYDTAFVTTSASGVKNLSWTTSANAIGWLIPILV